MIKIREAIIVEGKYDKIKLSQIVDTLIIQTNGFGIFKDNKRLEMIRNIAKTRGIIVFTDSDAAGFVIRNYIRSSIKDGIVKHAYIPEIYGKEKRKITCSKEGKLGVEGIDSKIILEIINNSTKDNEKNDNIDFYNFSKLDLYNAKLIGHESSKINREKLLKELNLPQYISSSELLRIINSLEITLENDIILEKFDIIKKSS